MRRYFKKQSLLLALVVFVILVWASSAAYAEGAETVTYYTTVRDAGIALRAMMVARQETCIIGFEGDSCPDASEIWDIALEHTGVPNEGDYLKFSVEYEAFVSGSSIDDAEDGILHFKYEVNTDHISDEAGARTVYTFHIPYRTTAAQEAEMDARIAAICQGFRANSGDLTILDVFNYTRNIPYSLYADGYTHTAYGALVRGLAVCEGFSHLTYRLLLEMGIDNRIVVGKARTYDMHGPWEGHAWNRVRSETGKYYDMDSTWGLFMLPENMEHVLFPGCLDAGFEDTYPLSKTRFNANISHVFDSETGTLTVTGSVPDIPVLSEGFYVTTENGTVIWDGTTPAWDDSLHSSTKRIVLTDSAMVISDYLFKDFINLEEVTIQGNITKIGNHAFDGCEKLVSINLPESLLQIGSYAFYNCSSLSGINLPENVKSIGEYAFHLCDSLAEVSIPSGITTIEDGTFSQCSALTDVQLPEGLTSIGNGAFDWCTSLLNIRIPNSVTRIGANAFDLCQHISTLQLPAFMYEIGDSAFASCYELRELVLPEYLEYLGESAFNHCNMIETSVRLPKGLQYVGKSAFEFFGKDYLIVELPDDLPYISDRMFYSTPLFAIELPDSVQYIGDEAFAASALRSILVPANVARIGSGAFACSELSRIDVAAGNSRYSSIDGVLFNKNQTLLIQYPGNSEGDYEVPATVLEIGAGAFEHARLQTVSLPVGLQSIGCNAFYGGIYLKSITIPDSVTYVGESAFSNCYYLKAANIGNGLIAIPPRMFSYCSELDAVTLGNGVTEIGEEAFRACDNLTSVKLPDSLITICARAFFSCNNLASVEFSSSLKMVGYDVFYDCGSLTNVKYHGTSQEWEKILILDGNDTLTNAELQFLGGYSSALTVDVRLDPCSGEEPSSLVAVQALGTYGTLPTPQREGYEFCGWFTRAVGGTRVTEETPVYYTDGHTLYAHWEDTVVESGNAEGCLWTIHNSGELDLYGTGILPGLGYHDTCPWWNMRDSVTSVVVEGTFTEIGEWGLACQYNAAELTLPDTIRKIGSNAINLSGFEEIVLPEGVIEIGEKAFYNCLNLKSIVLPESLEIIGDCAFGMEPDSFIISSCTELQSVTIPANVKQVGTWAFRRCTSLEEVECLSDSVSWGFDVFAECSALKTASVSGNISDYMFNKCTALETVEIFGNHCSEIGEYAFSECENLRAVELPDGVKTIGQEAFSYCKSLENITIPSGVKTIGTDAFLKCEALTQVTIPGTVEDFAVAFHCLPALKTVSLGYGITEVSPLAFYECSALEEIIIPERCVSIGTYAFFNCVSLRTVYLPSTLERIGQSAFDGCTTLETVYWSGEDATWANIEIGLYNAPLLDAQRDSTEKTEYSFLIHFDPGEGTVNVDSIRRDYGDLYGELPIPEYADHVFLGWFTRPTGGMRILASSTVEFTEESTLFAHWTEALYSGSLENELNWTLTNNGVLTIIGNGALPASAEYPWHAYTSIINCIEIGSGITEIPANAFTDCTAVIRVVFADSLRVIGNEAFAGLPIVTLSIPDGVISIGHSAFQNCTSLQSVVIADTVESVGENLFSGCVSLRTAELSSGCSSVSASMFSGCNLLKDIEIPAGVVSIGDHAFSECSSLQNALVSDTVTTVGAYAFSGCRTLQGAIGTGVTEISDCAYYGCRALNTEMPSGLVAIGAHAFQACYSLNTVSLPDSLTSIGEYAFGSCPFEEIVIPNSVQSIGKGVFYGCINLARVTLPQNTQELPDEFFYGCTALEDVQSILLSYPITRLGERVFQFCAFEEIVIPENIALGNYALSYNSHLQSVTLPQTLLQLPDGIFDGCSSLESITLPSSLTQIGFYAFRSCSALKEIDIPDSVTAIGDYAFQSCRSLENVTIPSHLSRLSNAFAGNAGISTVFFRGDAPNIYNAAFSGCTFTAYYPAGNQSWTPNMLQNYGGTVTWTPYGYAISYDLAGGRLADGQSNIDTYTEDTDEITLVNPTREHYEFAGWTGTGLDEATMTVTIPKGSSGDRSYTATWRATSYSITYELGGGSLAEGESNPNTYTIESNAITLVNPKREHYEFAGWTGTGLLGVWNTVTIPKGSTGDRTYTATWTPKYYSVKFVDEDGTTILKEATQYVYGTPATGIVKPADPTKAATAQYTYDFAGWSPEIADVTGDVTYTATYSSTVNKYLVNFVDDDGSVLQSTEVEYGATPSYTGQTPSKAATAQYTYTFKGWDKEIAEVTGDISYTATYTQALRKYTIIWKNSDGSIIDTTTVEYGIIPTHADPVKAATAEYTYTFAGWNNTPVAVTDTAIYVATYRETPNSYTIFFDTDGGSIVDAINLDYGAAITSPASPTKVDSIFLCWNPVLPATMPANDLVVKAIWAPIFGTPNFKLPVAIKQIEDEAFEDVSFLTVVDIPYGCESIGKWAFKNCTGLAQIRIPASVTYIDDLAFDGCTNVFVYGTFPSTASSFCDSHPNCTFVVEDTSE